MKNIKLLASMKKMKNEKVGMVLVNRNWFNEQDLFLSDIEEMVSNVMKYEVEVLLVDCLDGQLKQPVVRFL